jgi:hypothetical protein
MAITGTAAGPIRMGMTAREVQALPEMSVFPLKEGAGGTRGESYTIMRFGLPVGVVELEHGAVARIRVMNDAYETAEGVRVGMMAAEVETKLGTGRLSRDGSFVSAVFDRSPGFRYYFLKGLRGGLPDSWSELVRSELRLDSIRFARSLGDG